MRTALASSALLFLSPLAAAGAPAQGHALHAVEIEGCAGIPYPAEDREIWTDGERAVDPAARFWVLDRPHAFSAGSAGRRYRMGSGTLRVRSRLSPDLSEERVTIETERPIESTYLAVYLPGVSLPCERRARYAVRPLGRSDVDLGALERFDTALHAATELLYDEEFDAAEQRLQEAIELRRDQPDPYWMMARLLYLRLEARAAELSVSERVRGYRDAERWADEAVVRAPMFSEGYLWRGIAHGRIATSLGNVRLALGAVFGGRGPGWLEQTLRQAVSLRQSFRFFGFSTRGDALHALSQFYRLAPDAWYMGFIGTRGSIDRAIELSREAVRMQPTRIEYRKELAVSLLCRDGPGDREEAQRELRSLLALPVITRIDRIDHQHARRILADVPENVCGYSRDGFMEAGA